MTLLKKTLSSPTSNRDSGPWRTGACPELDLWPTGAGRSGDVEGSPVGAYPHPRPPCSPESGKGHKTAPGPPRTQSDSNRRREVDSRVLPFADLVPPPGRPSVREGPAGAVRDTGWAVRCRTSPLLAPTRRPQWVRSITGNGQGRHGEDYRETGVKDGGTGKGDPSRADAGGVLGETGERVTRGGSHGGGQGGTGVVGRTERRDGGSEGDTQGGGLACRGTTVEANGSTYCLRGLMVRGRGWHGDQSPLGRVCVPPWSRRGRGGDTKVVLVFLTRHPCMDPRTALAPSLSLPLSPCVPVSL